MNATPRLVVLAPLALLANACTTRAVDDSIAVTVDLAVQDVDLNCDGSTSDSEDVESKERQTGSVTPVTQSTFGLGTDCEILAYYRGAILNFADLEADLPDGVGNLEWTEVSLEVDELAVDVENFAELPGGYFYSHAVLAGTEDRIPEFESGEPSSAGRALLDVATGNLNQNPADPATLRYAFGGTVDTPTPLDALINSTTNTQGSAFGDPATMATIFNDAYENGAEDLYVFGGLFVEMDSSTLPATPSDITVTLKGSVEYTANAQVNLFQAASAAAE